MTSGARFVAGGTLSVESSTYVTRKLDAGLFETITAGEWALLLGPRQHGKSSALVRLYSRLLENGYYCVFIDLQRYGGDETSYPEFLAWLTDRIVSEVAADYDEPADRAQEDLQSWLEAVLPSRFANVAVLIDEITGVPEPFRERFFSQLRALYNSRANSDVDAVAKRTAFAFAGTFRPEVMIESENSPFNVSTWIISEDVTAEDAEQLIVSVLGEDSRAYAARAFEVVGGQPYLLQKLFAAIQATSSPAEWGSALTNAIEGVRSGADRHLPDLMRLVGKDDQLRELVGRLEADPPLYNGVDATHMFAVVSGVTAVVGSRLRIRNQLYRDAMAHLFGVAAQDDGEATPTTASASFDVVLVTATEVETAAVREVFTAGDQATFHGPTNTYRELGSYSGARVALVRSVEMGAGGGGGAMLTINDAIRDLEPSSIVLVGIAFGIGAKNQYIGDVLCATRVFDYEMQRVGSAEIQHRGVDVPTSPRLLGRFQNAQQEYDQPVEFGLMLSGDKLVDNTDFRDALVELNPNARGGEMEALGAYAAGAREKIDWIVVKAYCDWADGKKRQNRSYKQRLAAERAAQFVRFTLELGGFA